MKKSFGNLTALALTLSIGSQSAFAFELAKPIAVRNSSNPLRMKSRPGAVYLECSAGLYNPVQASRFRAGFDDLLDAARIKQIEGQIKISGWLQANRTQPPVESSSSHWADLGGRLKMSLTSVDKKRSNSSVTTRVEMSGKIFIRLDPSGSALQKTKYITLSGAFDSPSGLPVQVKVSAKGESSSFAISSAEKGASFQPGPPPQGDNLRCEVSNFNLK